MNISRFFIERPIFAGVLSIAIFIAGLLAMNALPISEYPEVVPPSVVVTATYPGAIAPCRQRPCQTAGWCEAMSSASSGAIPAATASRTIPLMWPESAMSSGSRSSVQKAILHGPYSSTSGSSARRFRAIDASRMRSHIPARSRSRPSSTVSASWSDRIPAAA